MTSPPAPRSDDPTPTAGGADPTGGRSGSVAWYTMPLLGPGPVDLDGDGHSPTAIGDGRGAGPSLSPDIALAVQRAQSGDAEAFGQIYDRYVDTVYRYVRYRVGQQQLAEDLTSETFLKALRRIDTFSFQGKDIGAWLVTIARNGIADFYKSSRARLEVSTDDISAYGRVSAQPGADGQVLDSARNEVLLTAVRLLNPEQQECIVLRFLQGMSVSETAEIMGKGDGAIKALQHRAIKSLGRLLPEGFEL